jgi:ferredoxin-NADP reductase
MTQAPAVPDDRTVVVTARSRTADAVVALALARPAGGRLPGGTPGAHVDGVLPNGSTRQYSLCGDRWDAFHYRIAVRREAGAPGASAYIHDRLREGDMLEIGGPRNHFPLVPADRHLFIAGGIGITPLLPMAAQAGLLGADWTLPYSTRRCGPGPACCRLAAAGSAAPARPPCSPGAPITARVLLVDYLRRRAPRRPRGRARRRFIRGLAYPPAEDPPRQLTGGRPSA